MLNGNLLNAVTEVGLPPGKHLDHHNAERVKIAPRVGILSPGLLGGNIMDRTYRLSVLFVEFVFQRRNAEVCYLDGSVPKQHDVMRFDIAMDDAAAVGMCKRSGDLTCKMQCFVPGQLALLFHILQQRHTVNQLHDDVFQRVTVADVIDRHNVGVRQHGHRMRLGTEAASNGLIRCGVFTHDLDRNISVQPEIRCPVDPGHAAFSYERNNLIASVQRFAEPVFYIYLFHTTIVTLSGAPLDKASSIKSRQAASELAESLKTAVISSSGTTLVNPSEHSSKQSPGPELTSNVSAVTS